MGREFVAHANRHYKARWLRAFAPASGVLRCVGALDGAPCAHAVLVDLRVGAGTAEREVGAALERLHLDHERPLCMRRATVGKMRYCSLYPYTSTRHVAPMFDSPQTDQSFRVSEFQILKIESQTNEPNLSRPLSFDSLSRLNPVPAEPASGFGRH